jgi:uncharacterized membrane protein
MTTLSNSLWHRPSTRLGWWAVGLMAAFIVEFLINGVFMQLTTNSWWQQNLLPSYGIIMLLCGLAAGILGLVAVIRQHERSWMVWVTILPLVFVVFLLLGEFLVPPH